MHFKEIVALLTQQLGPGVVLAEDPKSTPPAILVAAQCIAEVGYTLHTHEATYFDYLTCIIALDNGPKESSLELIYHLYSIPHHLQLMLKVLLPREKPGDLLPEVPSVSHIWQSADWQEREAYDMMGVSFTNHPDLRRILLPADWEGHPLRKDYTAQQHYHGITVE